MLMEQRTFATKQNPETTTTTNK